MLKFLLKIKKETKIKKMKFMKSTKKIYFTVENKNKNVRNNHYAFLYESREKTYLRNRIHGLLPQGKSSDFLKY